MRARAGFLLGEDDGRFEVRHMDGRRIGEGWTAQQVEAFFDVIGTGDSIDVALAEARELGAMAA